MISSSRPVTFENLNLHLSKSNGAAKRSNTRQTRASTAVVTRTMSNVKYNGSSYVRMYVVRKEGFDGTETHVMLRVLLAIYFEVALYQVLLCTSVPGTVTYGGYYYSACMET